MDLKKIFMELEISNFFSNIPYLGAMSKLSNKDILHYELDSIDGKKYIYIKNIRNYSDLVLGEQYDVIFSMNSPKNFQKTDVEIDYLTLKKGDNIGVMPEGRGGIVRLKFKNRIPEIIKLLRQGDDEKFDKDKHQYLFFTTQEIMNKILEELEKQENPIS